MTITHHPSDLELARFASGNLGQGQSLLLRTHLAVCPLCRDAVRTFDRIGGVFLEDLAPATYSSVRAAEIRETATCTPAEPHSLPAHERPRQPELPAPLADCDMGPWHWIGLGLHWRAVHLPDPGDCRVFLLRSKAGKPLPRHRHTGKEWTCVISGAFQHDLGRFGPGDFDEADEDVEHSPIVDAAGPCVCLVALEGEVMLQGLFGRLMQPLVQF